MQPEIQELYKRIPSHQGVQGFMVVLDDGAVLETSLVPEDTEKYRKEILQFTLASKEAITDLEPGNELQYLRLRSERREYICIPREKYFIIVITLPDKVLK